MPFPEKLFFSKRTDIKYTNITQKNNPNAFVELYTDPNYADLVRLTIKGQCLLANYYKEKYGVNILIAKDPIHFQILLDHYKKLPDKHIKVGFLVNASLLEDDAHRTTLLYEKKNSKEGIVVLDSLGVQGNSDVDIATINRLANKDRNKNQLIPINAPHSGKEIPDPNNGKKYIKPTFSDKRQADYDSCANDGFIILKDALQEDSIIDALPQTTIMKYIPGGFYEESFPFNAFLYPAKWAKTVQIPSYLTDMHIDLNTKIPSKDRDKADRTLQEFRDAHVRELEIQTYSNYNPFFGLTKAHAQGEPKKVKRNTYLKTKGYSNVTRIKIQYDKYENQLENIYAERQGEAILKQAEAQAAKAGSDMIQLYKEIPNSRELSDFGPAGMKKFDSILNKLYDTPACLQQFITAVNSELNTSLVPLLNEVTRSVREKYISLLNNRENELLNQFKEIVKNSQTDYAQWYANKFALSLRSWRHHHGSKGQKRALAFNDSINNSTTLKDCIKLINNHLTRPESRHTYEHSFDSYLVRHINASDNIKNLLAGNATLALATILDRRLYCDKMVEEIKTVFPTP